MRWSSEDFIRNKEYYDIWHTNNNDILVNSAQNKIDEGLRMKCSIPRLCNNENFFANEKFISLTWEFNQYFLEFSMKNYDSRI